MAAKRSTSSTRKESAEGGSRKSVAAPESALPGPDAMQRIQNLIDVMIRTGAVEVELQDEGQKIRVRLKEDVASAGTATPAANPPARSAVEPATTSTEEDDMVDGQELFKSPMVGTFYSSPSPDAEPFIRAGSDVEPDTTLCIIEAMKVMNEIKAERPLQIIDVLAQNGEPVEFGQPLFLVAV